MQAADFYDCDPEDHRAQHSIKVRKKYLKLFNKRRENFTPGPEGDALYNDEVGRTPPAPSSHLSLDRACPSRYDHTVQVPYPVLPAPAICPSSFEGADAHT